MCSNRAEHEIYLPSFEAAVTQAGTASVMCSYASVNGSFACNNSDLETGVLRDEWNFPGFMTSDYGALHSTQGRCRAPTRSSRSTPTTGRRCRPLSATARSPRAR